MTRLFGALLAVSLLALGGCAIAPPPTTPTAQFCNFRTYTITLPLSQGAVTDAPGSLVREIEARLRTRIGGRGGQPFRLLALSGGSLHGAFGAGFLDGWRRSNGGQLPEFDVVTGISTGSILSTFAFLGDTSRAVERYSITNESELLRPVARSRRDGSMSPFELIRVVRRGAVADLTPLRDTLLTGDATHPPEISPAIMAAVARAYDEGRTLLVGAVDVDTSQAVAFDLTHMAKQYVDAGAAGAAETPRQRLLRGCYVDAIMASSSAPLAAVPVFIDNGMYVDGGMRFGMFAGDVLEGATRAERGTAVHHEYFVIANGDLEVEPDCGRADPAACTSEHPTGQPTDPRSGWTLLKLARISQETLVNQVYRFSADRIIGARDLGSPVFFARIDRAALNAHQFRMDNPALDASPPGQALSCDQWHTLDKNLMHPIQFYPRYMHCLIDYGRLRGLGPGGTAPAWDIFPRP